MHHHTRRYAGIAAAALAVGGLVAGLSPKSPGLTDVQISDFGLVAANVNSFPVLDVIEDHVRPDFAGTGEAEGRHFNLGDLLYGEGEGSGGAGAAFDGGEFDKDILNQLTGGSLDPQHLPVGVPFLAEPGTFVAPTAGVFGGSSEQVANSLANSAVNDLSLALYGIPEAQQAVNAAVVAMQTEFNNSLVAAQQAAADRLFGDSPELTELVNWIFYVNNTVLAQNQMLFNSMFGISFDSHGSLLGGFAPDVANIDWGALLGLEPDQFNEIVNAIQADNLGLLLGSIDWDSIFAGLF